MAEKVFLRSVANGATFGLSDLAYAHAGGKSLMKTMVDAKDEAVTKKYVLGTFTGWAIAVALMYDNLTWPTATVGTVGLVPVWLFFSVGANFAKSRA